MSPHPRKFFLPLVLLLALLPALAEQEKKGSDETRPDIPIEQWLKGPDRTDFKWKAELLPARLTFQQRNLVQVRALLDVEALHGDDHHDFYFLLKIADEKGSWLPDETFNHYPLPPGIDKKNEIQYSSGFYAKPGKYTAALLLYDVATAKGNVWHRSFEVKAQKNDPLPELDRHIPTIEFITEVPTDALPSHDKVNTVTPARGRYGYGFGYPPIVSLGNTRDTSDLEWPPGHGFEVLPVRAPRRLRVDVILNLAPHIDPFQQRRNAAGEFRAVTGRMLQIGALISRLQVERGCVRVSAVDMSKLTTVFKPQDGLTADWDKLTEQARKVDHNTVSVDVLGKRKSSAGFLRDYLTDVITDATGCGPENQKVDRAIIVVSHDFQFPSGTHGDHLWPDVQCSCRFYHLRIHSLGSDDLEKFLKPANPHRFDASDAEHFRKVLADLIDALSGGRDRAREVAQ